MKVVVVVLACCIAAVSASISKHQSCYSEFHKSCSPNSETAEKECSAQYGKAHMYMKYLGGYVNEHLTRSMQYLLMSSHFGAFEQSREGFEKLFRKLSDETWEDAIDLLKYITLRGGNLELENFMPKSGATLLDDFETTELGELESLAKAVDIQKDLAVKAHYIYNHTNLHDPEMGAYVEDKFMHKHAKTVRTLVGLSNDLRKFVQEDKQKGSPGLQYFIVDEYLKKFI
ncbi:ferritin light chain [Anabrus simplex]|uniref:ferritin light chain n=1 Tax=Anabrus simplex TaxID=316456 RepID=UPI0034DD4361